jgi:hypothetical protein
MIELRTLLALSLATLSISGVAIAQDEPPFLLGPPPQDGPVVVQAGFYLSDVNRVDEEAQQFEVEGILTLRWRDERLAFDPAAVGVQEKVFQGNYQFSEVATGWWPQLIVANESGGYERQGMVLRQRFDGTLTYIEELNATIEIPLNLHRFPFDREEFEIVFEVLGFSKDEVLLEADPQTTGSEESGVSITEWRLDGIRADSREYDPVYGDGHRAALSAFVVTLEMARLPGFMLRVVVIPLALLVALSWSVFWMDRESLGDRMDISFIGILTVVAYQIMVSGFLPRISYPTLMSAFLYISFLAMCAAVVVNLRVGHLDRTGRRAHGDLVDRRCRWVFPLGYLVAVLLAAGYYFLRY